MRSFNGALSARMALKTHNYLMKTFSSRLFFVLAAATAATLLVSCAVQRPVPPGDRKALACTLPGSCVDSLGMGGLTPLKYRDTPAQAQAQLERTLKTFPEAKISHTETLTTQAIFTTPAGFRDQVDFQIDPLAQSIDFRSRSLFGLFDFGKNRSRMEEFVKRFQTVE